MTDFENAYDFEKEFEAYLNGELEDDYDPIEEFWSAQKIDPNWLTLYWLGGHRDDLPYGESTLWNTVRSYYENEEHEFRCWISSLCDSYEEYEAIMSNFDTYEEFYSSMGMSFYSDMRYRSSQEYEEWIQSLVHDIGMDSCLIPTPDGEKQIESISPGDMLFASDGSPTKVLSVNEFGEVPAYKIRLFDERWFICGEGYRVPCVIDGEITPTPVSELKSLMETKKVFLPSMTGIAEYEETAHVIPPYIAGFMISSGCFQCTFSNGRLGDEDLFKCEMLMTFSEEETAERIRREIASIDKGIRGESYLNSRLLGEESGDSNQDCKLMGKKALETCWHIGKDINIPKEYITDSSKNRIAFLKGFFDGDGAINTYSYEGRLNGSVSKYDTECCFLSARDHIYVSKEALLIAHSLGINGNINLYAVGVDDLSDNALYPGSGRSIAILDEIGASYRTAPEDEATHVPEDVSFDLEITSVEKMQDKVSFRTFNVDSSDGLYLGGNYLVMHAGTS